MAEELKTIRRPVLLKNATCPYCATDFSQPNVIVTKEHVIGRRFVPKGTLNNEFNLILRACQDCNHRKSDLEDEIAAASMMPNALGQIPDTSKEFLESLQRKCGRSINRVMGRPMADSRQRINISSSFGPLTMTYKMVGQPVVSSDRLARLAMFHVAAFFYWMKYDRQKRRGHVGAMFQVVNVALRQDWGNPRQRYFMNSKQQWENQLVSRTAGGFFQIAIRECPDKYLWSWALEWNKNYRLVGFFGHEDAIRSSLEKLPELGFREISRTQEEVIRCRREIPLEEGEDEMFVLDQSKW